MNEVRFVDRAEELKALREWCLRRRATPLYVYGPEGCGKTRLLKELVRRFSSLTSAGAIAVYIDALEAESVDKAILTPRSIQLSREVLASIAEKYTGLTVGEALSRSISAILEKAILKRRMRGNYVLVAVDDVARTIGLDRVEWYVKWLYELMWKLRESYQPEAINFIVTTSEGESLELISRHRHALIKLLWNLEEKAFRELAQELNPPESLDLEHVWKLTGGNPGKLIEIAEHFTWDTARWLESIREKLKPIARKILERNLTQELKLIVEDPDSIWHKPSPKMGELYQLLAAANLVIYKGFTAVSEAKVPANLELGIGEDYAWQIPAYRKALEDILK